MISLEKDYLFMMLSLDGYVEGPDHDISRHNVDNEFNSFAIEQLEEADVVLFGRRTYQLMEASWPKAARDTATSEENQKIAGLINNVSKIVLFQDPGKSRKPRIGRMSNSFARSTPPK